ncbi:MAG TPA: cadmium-translocating P-type ATPase [Firmicutes bacterium]|jgi:Cu+-exporting ATPase|nr:cadmium-translocating P-type ATPase [Bacillota bacterium]
MSSKTFLLRTVMALIAVFSLAINIWIGFELLQWLGLVFYLICFVMYAKSLYLALAKTKKVTADLLVVTVMIVSLLAGQPLSGALVAWFISMGLTISWAIIEKTRRKIEALTKERQKLVRVFRDETILELPVEEVREGDTVIVPQGEMIAVDGEIIEGSSSIDEAVITGEPFPVYKGVGDSVTSGAISLTSQLNIRATSDGDKGYLHVMAERIGKQLKIKPKIHQTADRIVQFFITGVVLYALGVFLFTGGLSGDAAAGLVRMAAVTAVACPCAWALSVPTAFAAAIGGLSGRGILASGGTSLEIMGQASTVVLDKTGTVTLAEPKVVGIDAFTMPAEELLQIAASVESGFNHPIANAIVSYAMDRDVQPLQAKDSEYLPGLGVKSSVRGRQVVLGSNETMKTLGLSVPAETRFEGTATWIGIDGEIAGVIIVQDELRDYVTGLGSELHELGMKKIVLATGDNEEAEARRVAQLIGADDFHWGLKPEDKVSLVKKFKGEGFTVMVGDGINDATALATADVGISIGHTKADLAIKSSDIIILRNDATGLLNVIHTGKKLIQIIKQNYAWAIGFNMAGIALATTGILTPWLAALFHHVSSVLVVLNSARLARK